MNRRIAELPWPEIRAHVQARRRTIVVAFGATGLGKLARERDSG